MKHISKRFLFQKEYSESEWKKIVSKVIKFNNNINKQLSGVRNKNPKLLTENRIEIQGFFYREKGANCVIPEPDQVLIYFNCAHANYSLIKNKKNELLKNLNPTSSIDEKFVGQIFDFFGLTSGFIIFLFSSIEAFMNRLILTGRSYKRERPNCTEVFNEIQIQKGIQFDEKLNKVLPEFTGKNFMKDYPLKAIHITNLEKLRDELIHVKCVVGPNTYDYISKKALKFKYKETIECVRDLMNYYIPNFIIECPCESE